MQTDQTASAAELHFGLTTPPVAVFVMSSPCGGIADHLLCASTLRLIDPRGLVKPADVVDALIRTTDALMTQYRL